MMASFVSWLHATPISLEIRTLPWLWPLCETLHFIGLSMLLGVVGMLDLRLLGFIRRVPLSALRGLLPWGIAGFIINLITGMVFFVGAPEQYMSNVAFWLKILFLFVAGVNALYFEMTQGRRVLTMSPAATIPTAFKVAGVVSLCSWLMVLYWGRMLPFVGNAF